MGDIRIEESATFGGVHAGSERVSNRIRLLDDSEGDAEASSPLEALFESGVRIGKMEDKLAPYSASIWIRIED